jgi:hypothetical protein
MNNFIAYAVYDRKAINYDVPFFAKSDLFAKRKFVMDVMARSRNTMISSFKDDFELHRVGEFCPDTGTFINTYDKGKDNLIPIIIKGKEINTNEINNETPV